MTDAPAEPPPAQGSYRKFLVVADDTPEFAAALKFACLRAKATGGRITMLRVLEPAVFEHWSGVREEMERQQRSEAEALLRRERPNLALLDAVLLDGGTVPLARRLAASEVPFAVVGGRDHGLLDRPPLRGTPRLPEPRTLPRLRAVVRQLYRLDLTRSLTLTERDIARAWESITAQARIVGGLAAGGRDVRRAEELLQAHERVLAILEARRDRLRRELERQGGPACWPDWPGLSPDAA